MRKLTFILLVSLGLLLAACSGGEPSIVVEADNLELGTVTNGEIVTRELFVRNEGEADLVVDSVSTSCGCTQATLSPMTIAPGQSGTLHIEFDSGAHGEDLNGALIRQVFITSNDPNQPDFVVEMSVTVEPKSS